MGSAEIGKHAVNPGHRMLNWAVLVGYMRACTWEEGREGAGTNRRAMMR